jgi:hypothetical protein
MVIKVDTKMSDEDEAQTILIAAGARGIRKRKA